MKLIPLLLFLSPSLASAKSVNHSLHCVSRSIISDKAGDYDEQEVGWFNTKTSKFHTDRYTYIHYVKDTALTYSTKLIVKKGKPLFVYELLNKEFRGKKGTRRIATESNLKEGEGFFMSFGGNVKKKDGTPLRVEIFCDKYKKTKLKKTGF